MNMWDEQAQRNRIIRMGETVANELVDKDAPLEGKDEAPRPAWLRRLSTILVIAVIVALLAPVVWLVFFA